MDKKVKIIYIFFFIWILGFAVMKYGDKRADVTDSNLETSEEIPSSNNIQNVFEIKFIDENSDGKSDAIFIIRNDNKKYKHRLLRDEIVYSPLIKDGLNRIYNKTNLCNDRKGGNILFGGLSTSMTSKKGRPVFFATCGKDYDLTVYFDNAIWWLK